MRTRKANKIWLVAGGIAAAVAASGGAFTNGLDFTAEPDETVASGNVTVDGGTVLDIEYNLATAGGTTDVTSIDVLFDGVYDIGAVQPDDLFFGVSLDGTDFTCGVPTLVDSDADGGFHDATNVNCTHAGLDLSTVQDTHIVVNSEEPPVATQAI